MMIFLAQWFMANFFFAHGGLWLVVVVIAVFSIALIIYIS